MLVCSLEHREEGFQQLAVCHELLIVGRMIRTQEVEQRLVVLIDEHHHAPTGLLVERFQDMIKAQPGIETRFHSAFRHNGIDVIRILDFGQHTQKIIMQSCGIPFVTQIEIEKDDRILSPLLLKVHDLQPLEEVAATLEVALQCTHEQAFAETAGTG